MIVVDSNQDGNEVVESYLPEAYKLLEQNSKKYDASDHTHVKVGPENYPNSFFVDHQWQSSLADFNPAALTNLLIHEEYGRF